LGLPERSAVIYEVESRREGFRKFIVWLTGNELLTVECDKLYYDKLEL